MYQANNRRLTLLHVAVVVSLVISILLPIGTWAAEPDEGGQTPDNVYMPSIANPNQQPPAEVEEQPLADQPMERAAIRTTQTAQMAAPTARETINWQDQIPPLTQAEQAQVEAGLKNSHLPGPARTPPDTANAQSVSLDTASNVVGQETVAAEDIQAAAQGPSPQVPGSALLYRRTSATIPTGFKSNVQEVSVAEGGKFVFKTGNWFAARSTNGGTTWSYVNAYTGFSDFCCDQVTIYDNARNRHFWYRQGIANASGVNRARLGVSADGGATFCNYDYQPNNVNSAWTNQWWDYPHLQLSADYLYIASNVFNAAGSWTRTVILRWPLDALANCAAFSYNYYNSTSWFTFVPVQGADHIIYFASNFPPSAPWNRIGIWKWAEDSTSLTQVIKTVAVWSWVDYQCGASSGNWGGRSDDRLLTGARYAIQGTNLKIPGRNVIAWWWNGARQSGFAQPYVEAAAFFEDTLAQVGGAQGRPFIWNSNICFLYPSAAANARGDLGLVFHYGDGTAKNPNVGYSIVDDFVAVPPGFSIFTARTSAARPADNRWGDYNTVRPFYPTDRAWIAGSHYIAGTSNCTNCALPVFFAFGRERDYNSWNYWQNK